MNISSKFFLCLILVLSIISGCGKRSVPQVVYQEINLDCVPILHEKSLQKKKKSLMVIFVHGTILPFPSFSSFRSVMSQVFSRKKSKKTVYEYYLHSLRYKSFCKYQPIGNFGLEKISVFNSQKQSSFAAKAAHLYKSMYKQFLSDPYKNYLFYTFGWNGRLNKKNRKKSAAIFYQDLIKEISRIRKNLDNDEDIDLHIVAHSHGGNVVLNLAQQEKIFKQHLQINKLILMGTPIQSETEHLMQSDVFEKVYNVYSRGDAVQIIDIVSTKDSISRRRFKKDTDSFLLTKKLIQIEVAVGNKKPLHNELWFFGSKNMWLYRKSLVTYPLPIFIFMPIVMACLDDHIQDIDDVFLKIKKDKKFYRLFFDEKNISTCGRSVSINLKQIQE